MLALQRSAGNQAAVAMLRRSRLGSAPLGVQRGNGNDPPGSTSPTAPQDEKAKQIESELSEKGKQEASGGQVPERATDEDKQKGGVLIEHAARVNGDGADVVASQKLVLDEVVNWWNDEQEVVASLPDAIRTQEASPRSEEEESESEEEDEGPTGEDPNAVVNELEARASTDAESSQEPTKTELSAAPEDESEAPEAESGRNALEQLAALTRAPAAPERPLRDSLDESELAMMRMEIELPAIEQHLREAERLRAEKEPQEPSLGATVVKTTDAVFGPGPEATPSAVGGTFASLGPVWTATDQGGLGKEGSASEMSSFGVGFAGAMDFIGNLARLITGVMQFVRGVRNHKGHHKLTSKDSRIGLGFIAQGALGAAAVLVGLIKAGAGTLSKVGEFVAGPLAGGVGVVLGLINATLAIRRAVRAGKRQAGAEETEANAALMMEWNTELAEKEQGAPGRRWRQDKRFWNRLRAAASMLGKKASRKKWRKWGAGLGSLVGAGGGALLLLVTLGVITAANIWNPVGWALAGAGLAVAIGYGLYKLYRRIRQSKSRKEDLEAAKAPSFWTGKDKQSQVTPGSAGDYAKFVKTELDCTNTRGHENREGHERIVADFVKRVLGKKPEKVKGRDESYIAGKWASW